MADGLAGIITQLEQQKASIDRALAALRDIEGIESSAPALSPTTEPAAVAPPARKRRMSPEGKKRLIAALKKRWANKKAAQAVAVATPPAPAPRKAQLTAEGRKRLAAAMRKRWALAKAAGTTPINAAKKAGARKAAPRTKNKAA